MRPDTKHLILMAIIFAAALGVYAVARWHRYLGP